MGGPSTRVHNDRREQGSGRENGEEGCRKFVYVGVTPPAGKEERDEEDQGN